VQMPEMDGLEATALLKGDDRTRQLPVVALTAHAMASDRERFLEAGMDDYLAKPIEERDLLRVLSHWLPATAATPDDAEVTPPHDAGLPTLDGVDLEAALARVNG